MGGGWRKGWDMHPFCHPVIKTIRHDLPPWLNSGKSFCKLLQQKRLALGLTQEDLTEHFKVGVRTLKNWERGWTRACSH